MFIVLIGQLAIFFFSCRSTQISPNSIFFSFISTPALDDPAHISQYSPNFLETLIDWGEDTDWVQTAWILELVEGISTEIHSCLLALNLEKYELEALKWTTWSLRQKRLIWEKQEMIRKGDKEEKGEVKRGKIKRRRKKGKENKLEKIKNYFEHLSFLSLN